MKQWFKGSFIILTFITWLSVSVDLFWYVVSRLNQNPSKGLSVLINPHGLGDWGARYFLGAFAVGIAILILVSLYLIPIGVAFMFDDFKKKK